VGLPPGGAPTSFLVLADPKFQQTRPLLAGLDFAFPGATKVRGTGGASGGGRGGAWTALGAAWQALGAHGQLAGARGHMAPSPWRPHPQVGGVISSGQRYKRRAMYAWSADGPVQAGSKARKEALRARRLAREEEQRRQQGSSGSSGGDNKGAAAGSELAAQQGKQPQAVQQQQQLGEQEGKEQGGSFFGSLFNKFKAGFAEEAPSSSGSGSGGSGGDGALEQRPGGDRRGAAWRAGEGEEERPRASGMHMYGAAVLALRGSVYFDPITSQGYRAVSDRSWVVGRVSRDGNVIYSLVDPAAPPSAPGEDDEVPPLLALCDLMEEGAMGKGGEGELTDSEL
jgi:hypothetical protein